MRIPSLDQGSCKARVQIPSLYWMTKWECSIRWKGQFFKSGEASVTHKDQSFVNPFTKEYGIASVAFFILEVGGGIIKYILKYFKTFLLEMFFIENHWRHQYVRSSMANHCRKHSPLSRSILRALLCPNIDPRLRMDHPPMQNPYSGIGEIMWA